MKKQTGSVLFLVICLIVCLVPLCGMIRNRTDTNTEKRRLAEWPEWVGEDGSFNVHYLQEAGAYFNDHFALRNEMIAADSLFQSRLFHQSPVDTVLTGTDDWLYYTSSLNDYLGTAPVSETGAYHIAHNLRIVQDKMEQEGIAFAFTIAPNKNSLYDANMPYYDRVKASGENTRSKTVPFLQQLDVRYIDLYAPFQSTDEILYRKQDSHWNGKGAVLAYNTIMDALEMEHEDYSDVSITRTRTEVGDLGTALYSVAAKPEWDYRYEKEPGFTFTTDSTSWEDLWIQTEAAGKDGSLLMFRDSFGNTLSPLIAGEYGKAAFSKDSVYHLDSYIDMTDPDLVLFEIVERNLSRYGEYSRVNHSTGPPVMEAPAAQIRLDSASVEENAATAEVSVSDQQSSYICITGLLDESYMQEGTHVYAEITAGEETGLYEAYTCTDIDQGLDSRYLLYLGQDRFPDHTFSMKLYAVEPDGQQIMLLQQDLRFE